MTTSVRPPLQPRSRGVVGQAGVLALGRLGAAGLQAVSFVILARQAGPDVFGVFAAVYGVALVFQSVATLGLGQFVVSRRATAREVDPTGHSETDHRDVLLALRMNWSSTAAVGGVVCCGLAVAVLAGGDQHLLELTSVLLLWAVVDNYAECWLSVSLADGRVWQNSVLYVLRRGLAVLVLLIGVLAGGRPDILTAVGLLTGSVCAAALARRFNKRSAPAGFRFGWSTRVMRLSLGYWMNSVLLQLRNLDVAIYGVAGASPQAVGAYAAASRLTSPLRILPTSFATVLMPHAARSGIGRGRELVRAVAAISILSTVLFGTVIILVPWVTEHVLGSAYKEAASPIQIVCLSLIFAAVSSQLNAVLLGWRRSGLAAMVAAVSTAVCFGGLVVAVVAGGGAVAGAAALAVSYVVQLLLLLVVIAGVTRHEKRAR